MTAHNSASSVLPGEIQALRFECAKLARFDLAEAERFYGFISKGFTGDLSGIDVAKNRLRVLGAVIGHSGDPVAHAESLIRFITGEPADA